MSIILSEIILQQPQRDGRIVVREKHIDDEGTNYFYDYVADRQAQIAIKLAQRKQDINQYLLDRPTPRQQLQLERGLVVDQITRLGVRRDEIDIILGTL